MFFKRLFLAAFAVMALACTSHPREGIRRASPDSEGMDPHHLALIDSAVNVSIGLGEIPGAVVGVVRGGVLVYEKAFGKRQTVPVEEPMQVEYLFDLASLSKCVSTTVAVMQLVEQGKVRLVDPVRNYIPGFRPWVSPDGEQVEITVQHLLTHSSGLDAYVPDMEAYLSEFGPGTPEDLLQFIATRSGRNFRPGTRALYSCLNFVTLQHIVQRVTGESLSDYAQHHIFDVLGLRHTTYFPLDGGPVKPELAALCVPTEVQEDGLPLKAQVHDPIARIINRGNSGNAGVFSNVEDLAVIAAALLDGGAWNGRRILSPHSVRKMFEMPYPGVPRALGWDTYREAPYTSGDLFETENLRGHTGYTGTSLILDPDTSVAVILLTNRVHPVDTGSVSRLRGVVANIVAGAIL